MINRNRGKILVKQKQQYKLILFDMDGILLEGKTINIFAEKKGFTDQLSAILLNTKEPYEKSIEIAKLLRGRIYQELLDIFREIPLQEHVEAVISSLREKQIKTALVTDGYQRFAYDLKKRLSLDYAFANRLTIENHFVTGDLLFQNQALLRNDNGKIYSICKRSVLDFLCTTMDITPNEVIAVGNAPVDIDLLEYVGLGIAYRAPPDVRCHADIVIDDLRLILDYIEEPLQIDEGKF
jgi:HAD superfamily phosphoserine phosphatase-like hydrolase